MDQPRPEEEPESPDELEEQVPRAESPDAPRPEPGVTSPLDDVSPDERGMEPVGVMPGAGPDERDVPPTTEGEGSDQPEEQPPEKPDDSDPDRE
jgi:hypothetical protein